MDLDALKLKTSDELSDPEKDFLRSNVDKLNDEDKEAYADFLSVTPDGGGDDGANNNDAGNEPPAPPAPPADGNEPPAPTPPAPQAGLVFKDEEEAKAFVAKTVAEEQQKQKQAAIDAAKTPEEKRWVEDNWMPKTWNEGIQVAVDAALKAVDERNQKQTKEQEDKKKVLEEEWDGIVTANKLPARGTEEGAKVLKAVYDIGLKYQQPNFTKAYELYSQIPTTQGGGLQVTPQKKDTSANREAASRIAGNTPAGDSGKGVAPKSYQDLHNKTQSQLIRDAMKATA